MRIAIVGIRGIPGRYGGFETFVENLAPNLVSAGHEVTVFNRGTKGTRLENYLGVSIKTIPTLRNKFLDTIVHTSLALVYVALHSRHFDVALVCNVGNSPVAWLPRLRGIPVVLNVDGLEWQRKKWPVVAKWYLRWCEKVATYTANQLVTDALVIQEYYRERYRHNTTMIPYGAQVDWRRTPLDRGFLGTIGLEPKKFFLYVSRLEPENNADLVIKAFLQAGSKFGDYKLAVVGDAPYATGYKEQLLRLARRDQRIVMPGGIYGAGYQILQRNAVAYIHATSVGGTHPALVEGMAHGNTVLYYGSKENVEVAGDCGVVYHDVESLASLLDAVAKGNIDVERYGKMARERVATTYSWNVITKQYEDLFRAARHGKVRLDAREQARNEPVGSTARSEKTS